MSTNKEIFDQFTNTIIPELKKVSGSLGSTMYAENTENSLTIETKLLFMNALKE